MPLKTSHHSTKLFSFISTQRYKSNEYIQNNAPSSTNANSHYLYYVRPFIPFFSVQNLDFTNINELTEIPKQRENKYPRYVLEKLGRTWIGEKGDDTNWFDKATIFEELHKDLVARLASKCVVDSSGEFPMSVRIYLPD